MTIIYLEIKLVPAIYLTGYQVRQEQKNQQWYPMSFSGG